MKDDAFTDDIALRLRKLRKIEVDVDFYKEMLDDPALSDDQKEQIIIALWQIIIAFVDLGFGVHPAQQVCGQDDKSDADSPHESSDGVYLEEISKRVPDKAAHGDKPLARREESNDNTEE
ncbi:MAG: hypothetical protein AAGH70_13465 [Pseudomonadota bacterium]